MGEGEDVVIIYFIVMVAGLLLGMGVALTPAAVRCYTQLFVIVVDAMVNGPPCSVVVGCGGVVGVGCLGVVVALLLDVVVVVVVVPLVCVVMLVSQRSSSAGKIFLLCFAWWWGSSTGKIPCTPLGVVVLRMGV